MFFAAGPLEQAVVNTSFGWKTSGPQEKRRAGYGASGCVAALTGHLEKHDYIADGRFTAADVYVGSQIGWGMQFGGIPASDTVAAYWNAIEGPPCAAGGECQGQCPDPGGRHDPAFARSRPQGRLPPLAETGWAAVPGKDAIRKVWKFRNFSEAWGFMSRAALAGREGEPPPGMANVYNVVDVTLTTHDCHGPEQAGPRPGEGDGQAGP
jgi:pterin-4a-carbinolamine dehydratase